MRNNTDLAGTGMTLRYGTCRTAYQDGCCGGHDGEDYSREQGRRHRPRRIPEAPQ